MTYGSAGSASSQRQAWQILLEINWKSNISCNCLGFCDFDYKLDKPVILMKLN